MADALNLLVEPPKAGRKGSTADATIVTAMAAQIGEGKFVTDGQTYRTGSDAVNAANIYRRALALEMNVEPYKLTSRVWGTDAKGKAIDRKTDGTWHFALTHEPKRSKGQKSGVAATA